MFLTVSDGTSQLSLKYNDWQCDTNSWHIHIPSVPDFCNCPCPDLCEWIFMVHQHLWLIPHLLVEFHSHIVWSSFDPFFLRNIHGRIPVIKNLNHKSMFFLMLWWSCVKERAFHVYLLLHDLSLTDFSYSYVRLLQKHSKIVLLHRLFFYFKVNK